MSVRRFCEGKPFKATTLRWWTRRLRDADRDATVRHELTPRPVEMVRVHAVSAKAVGPTEIAIEVGRARVVVRRGFDAALLREVLGALEATR